MKKITAFISVAVLAFSALSFAAEVSFPKGECFSDSLLSDGSFNPDYKAIQFKMVNGVKTACIDGMSRVKNDAIEVKEDVQVDSIVYNRYFSETGVYSTIVLPFDMNPGCSEGADFFQIAYIQNNNTYDPKGDWGIYISQPMQYMGVVAGRPYILRKTSVGTIEFKRHGYTGPCNFVIGTGRGAQKTSFSANLSKSAGGLPGVWEFYGTYEKFTMDESTSGLGKIYGFAGKAEGGASVGQFVKGKAGAYVLPMRAYLKYNSAGTLPDEAKNKEFYAKAAAEPSSADLPASFNVYVIDGENKEGVTLIGRMDARSGEITAKNSFWYDLKGRKMNRRPTAKGTFYRLAQ